MKITPKRLMLILALTLNLVVSLILATLLVLGGMLQCFDGCVGGYTPNPGPYIYGTLALIWGIGPFIYLFQMDRKK